MALRPPHCFSEITIHWIYLVDPPTGLDPHFHSGAVLTLLRHPIVDYGSLVVQEY